MVKQIVPLSHAFLIVFLTGVGVQAGSGLGLVKKSLIDNFHAVQDGVLYRSAQLSPESLEKYIKTYGIKTVINLRGSNPKEAWWQYEQKVCKKNYVEFYNIPMSAQVLPSKDNVKNLLDVYDTAPTPILIHCQGGADRTGEAAALWCIEKMGLSKKKALEQLVGSYGHIALRCPAKRLFITMWQGREWLENEYNSDEYPIFYHDLKRQYGV